MLPLHNSAKYSVSAVSLVILAQCAGFVKSFFAKQPSAQSVFLPLPQGGVTAVDSGRRRWYNLYDKMKGWRNTICKILSSVPRAKRTPAAWRSCWPILRSFTAKAGPTCLSAAVRNSTVRGCSRCSRMKARRCSWRMTARGGWSAISSAVCAVRRPTRRCALSARCTLRISVSTPRA